MRLSLKTIAKSRRALDWLSNVRRRRRVAELARRRVRDLVERGEIKSLKRSAP